MSAGGPRTAISVVLPIYLNRESLPELHARLTRVLTSLTPEYEIVFVEDAGGDGSLEWIQECRRRDPHVALVASGRNQGQHRAVMSGLARASGDITVVMDADLQDRPEDVPMLVQALGPRDGVVFARRVARHQSRGRHLTGRLFKRLLRLVAGSRIPPGTGMFWAASRPVVRAVCETTRPAPYVPLLLEQVGARMFVVDIPKDMRQGTRSAYGPARRLALGLRALRQAVTWRLAGRRTRRPGTGIPL